MKYGGFFLVVADIVAVVYVVIDVVVDVVVDAVNKRSGRQACCSLGFFSHKTYFPTSISSFSSDSPT